LAAGHLVLKPVVDEDEATWLAEVLAALPESRDVRVIRPVRSISGRWIVQGWAAWERLDGHGHDSDWRRALDVSARFHALVATVPRPDGLRPAHPWAVGDRFAWGEDALVLPVPFRDLAARLRGRLGDVDLPCQLVHGDLINNVLFHDGLPPAVIDVSPCWRPARYADAVIVVDAIGWGGAGAEAAASMRDPDGAQLLIRAALFRLASAALLCEGDPGRLPAQVPAYERIEALALA
jgi:uncharacterized protein (TIGR02569 family)